MSFPAKYWRSTRQPQPRPSSRQRTCNAALPPCPTRLLTLPPKVRFQSGSRHSIVIIPRRHPTLTRQPGFSRAVIHPSNGRDGSGRSIPRSVFACASGRFQIAPVNERGMVPVGHRPTADCRSFRIPATCMAGVLRDQLEGQLTTVGRCCRSRSAASTVRLSPSPDFRYATSRNRKLTFRLCT